jgi:hypothetical protein
MKKLIPLALLLAGCTDSTVYLKNPKTGDIVKCGDFHAQTLVENTHEARDAKCIDDYKEQGYLRIPKP